MKTPLKVASGPRSHSEGEGERQTSNLLRARRRIPYAGEVSNELEILQEFPFAGRQEWSRRLQDWRFDGPKLRLDWLVHLGGPLRRRLEECLAESSELHLVLGLRPDPVMEFEIRHWLESFQQRASAGTRVPVYLETGLSDEAFDQWNISLRDVAVVLRTAAESEAAAETEFVPMESFLRKVIGGASRANAPSPDVEKASAIFRQIWREQKARETPWMALRHWLRERDTKDLAPFSVQREIERMISYLSPQDEVAELESLAVGQVMVNPTLEILTKPFDRTAPLFAIARYRGDLIERELGLAEAALIEAIREDFRADEGFAMSVACRESRVSTDEIARALQRLKLEGLVLSPRP